MENIRLSDLSAPITPSKVSIRDNSLLSNLQSETLSSNNILVTKDVATYERKVEYLPIINKTLLDKLNVKKDTINDDDGNIIINKISNFQATSDIILKGKYPQNTVKFPKFRLNTNIKTLPDINFRFILSVKRNVADSNPQLYTSDKFYNELASSYWENNPHMVANAIKSEAIVSIVYEDYLTKLNEFRTLELNVGKVGVVVAKNLFVNSNYNITEINDSVTVANLIATPTTDIDDLVRYIDWVVSKPSTVYDERIQKATDIGAWVFKDGTPSSTPSLPTPAGNEPPRTTPTYPPIGRAGFYPGEEVTNTGDNSVYKWSTESGGTWIIQSDPPYPPIGRAGFYQDELATYDNKVYMWTNFTGGRWLYVQDL
jgi:hypothetical protein